MVFKALESGVEINGFESAHFQLEIFNESLETLIKIEQSTFPWVV